MVAFTLLEPARLGRFRGGVAGGTRVLLDREAICFRGASSPVHLRAVLFVRAIVIASRIHSNNHPQSVIKVSDATPDGIF